MKKIIFEIFRFDPGKDKSPRFQKYEIERRAMMTALHGLLEIQAKIDPTLAFRSSCRAAVCGSCAMHIGGAYRLACETQVDELGNHVVIRPLGQLKVIKDLVVEMEPFWNKYEEIKPFLISGKPLPDKEFLQTQDDREKLTTVIDCILCGCCYSACPVVGTSPEYIGPAAFAKAARFILDSRDNAKKERFSLTGGTSGVWRCHTVFSCQKVCPKEINPSGLIAEIKRGAIADKLSF